MNVSKLLRTQNALTILEMARTEFRKVLLEIPDDIMVEEKARAFTAMRDIEEYLRRQFEISVNSD